MAGSLVLSLDFELMWGVRDHRRVADYGDAVLGVRTAIPAMLQRFRAHGIHATWATVGLVFARNREEMLAHSPRLRPAYANAALSPYGAIENEIGPDEDRDPLHYGASLVARIAETEGQEIATHTFSHYYCMEPGQTLDSFEADVRAAKSIATASGHDLSTIVFPRNQMTDEHIACCVGQGITCFRGNQEGFAYRSRAARENSLLVRGVRLLDGILPLTGGHGFARAKQRAGATDVTASRFLRPWSGRFPAYSALHMRRVMGEMRDAARRGEIYHLWWHPHNLGRDQAHNLSQLDRILACYAALRDRYGMRSSNMREIAAESTREQRHAP